MRSGLVLGILLGAPMHRAPAQEPAPAAAAQEPAPHLQHVLDATRKLLRWDVATEPAKIAGPLHYVGTAGLASYLFATREGCILFNTGMPGSGPMIAESIRKLGFDSKSIKILIIGHGHADHAGALAWFKELSGAQLAVMEGDVAMIEDGGRSDFHYGRDWQIMGQPPVKVDRILRDGDVVRLGEVALTAHHTPGHTRGATTWETVIEEGGKSYRILWPDGGGFNPGYRIGKEPGSYPGINADYRRTHHFHEMQKPDVFLGAHAEWFGYETKRERAKTEGIQAWLNQEEYRRFVAGQKRAFEDQVDVEMGVKK